MHLFQILVNFWPLMLLHRGPANSIAGFEARAGAGARPGASGGGDEAAGILSFAEFHDFHFWYEHGYGKVANAEAPMAFLEDRAGVLY